MNWLQRLVQITAVIPYVVMGIQQIHTDAAGADKKTLAMEALGLASAVGQTVLPGEAALIQAITSLASSTIDNTVAALHQANAPGFGTNSAPAAKAAGA